MSLRFLAVEFNLNFTRGLMGAGLGHVGAACHR